MRLVSFRGEINADATAAVSVGHAAAAAGVFERERVALQVGQCEAPLRAVGLRHDLQRATRVIGIGSGADAVADRLDAVPDR